jgi:hypothetical protein
VRAALGLLFVLASAGCATSGGAWTAKGFAQEKYGWKADYVPGQKVLLGPAWRLDNWATDARGILSEKIGPGYTASRDEDGDGVITDWERNNVYLYDLKFTNVHNNGMIWVKSRPLDEADAGKDLDVLLENYVSEQVGVGYVLWNLKAEVSTRDDVKLDKYPAISALVQLVPVKPSSDDRTATASQKMHIVLTRFDYVATEQATSSVGSMQQTRSASSNTGTRRRRTAMLVVGYINDGERFDTGVGDFAKLLAELKLPDEPAAALKPGAKKPAPAAPAAPPSPATPAPSKPKPDPDNPALEI